MYIKVAKLRTGVGSAEIFLGRGRVGLGGGVGLGGQGSRIDVNEELKFL